MSMIYVFLGGGIGASLRYLVSLCISIFVLPSWIGTLIVNVIGSFLIIGAYDLIMSLQVERQLLIRVGFLGGLTTFSTMSFEIIELIKKGSLLEGVLVLTLNIFFGIVVGIFLSR